MIFPNITIIHSTNRQTMSSTMISCVSDAISHFGLDRKPFEDNKVYEFKDFVPVLTMILPATRENFKRFCEWKDAPRIRKYDAFSLFTQLITPDDFDSLCKVLDCTLDPSSSEDKEIFDDIVFAGNIQTILHVAKKCDMTVNWDILVNQMVYSPVAFKEILEVAPEGVITARKVFKSFVRMCCGIYTGPIVCLQMGSFVSFETYHAGEPLEALKLAINLFGSKYLPSFLHTLKNKIPAKDLQKFNVIRDICYKKILDDREKV